VTVDPLSDVLKTVRLTGATFFDVAAREPWVAEQPARELILRRIRPDAHHLIAYHLIVEGRCFASIVGEKPVVAEAGEVIVFTKGDPHVMSSAPGMRAGPSASAPLDAIERSRLPFFINLGADGPIAARLVCGFLACDARPFNPLLDNLPRVIKAGNPEEGDKGWLGQLAHLAMIESADKRAGGESVLARLSELMFIEVVRRHLENLPPDQVGWLAGLRDQFVGKALSLIHASPAHDWTIEELAKKVGLSRSVLSDRFACFVEMPPMHYLAKWRMQVAAGLLASGNQNIAAIAAETGYGSEAAFSRAFKKIVGMPPSEWRRRIALGQPMRRNDCSSTSNVRTRDARH